MANSIVVKLNAFPLKLGNLITLTPHCFRGSMSCRKTGQSHSFSSCHVQMWELDHNKSVPKNWYFWIVVLEKTLESSLNSKEIQPVSLKGNQPWIFIGSPGSEAEAAVLWPPDTQSRLIGKDSFSRKDWRQKEKEAAEVEMVDSITQSMDLSLSKLHEMVKDREVWCAALLGGHEELDRT